ncbi:MAG: hypothetical protein COB66_02350 [Coxiella sp. (in: Bacteria)]|nr:MAG: hypothetical protein COB66_02350 [Coxiella sp. (in: g-proteobacteria)]
MTRYDTNLLISCGLLLMLCATAFLWNSQHAHYMFKGFSTVVLHRHAYVAMSGMWLVAGFLIQNIYPRIALIAKTIGFTCLTCILLLFAETCAFTTPFSLQNHTFYHFDLFVGFHQKHVMQFVHGHPWLNDVLNTAYIQLLNVLKIAPFVLAALNDKKKVYTFFIGLIVSCIIGFTIYYFLPTTNPSSSFHSSYFMDSQYLNNFQFHAIHTHHSIDLIFAGIIGFPSFHVIWALLIAYVAWDHKWLRYPAALLAALVLISTLSTGWHYLADILGGIGVTAISIYITNRYFIRSGARELLNGRARIGVNTTPNVKRSRGLLN